MTTPPPVITGLLRATRCAICGDLTWESPRSIDSAHGFVIIGRAVAHLLCAVEEADAGRLPLAERIDQLGRRL